MLNKFFLNFRKYKEKTYKLLPGQSILYISDDDSIFISDCNWINIKSPKLKNILVRIGYDDYFQELNANFFYSDGAYRLNILLLENGLSEIKKITFDEIDSSKIKSIQFERTSIKYELLLKINLHSGIGDCLRTISWHRSLYSARKYYKLTVDWTYAALSAPDCGWATLLNQKIFSRIKNFKYATPEAFSKLDCYELFNGYHGMGVFSDFFPRERQFFPLPLSFFEKIKLRNIPKVSGISIGVQLQGNDARKRWCPNNYIELFQGLIRQYPGCNIYLLDSPDSLVDERICFSNQIINLIGKTNLSENINLIKRFDVWISPDSFSKYVANWSNIPQVVLCVKLPYISPSEMLFEAFSKVGLYPNTNVVLAGLTINGESSDVTVVEALNDISPKAVLNAVSFLLASR